MEKDMKTKFDKYWETYTMVLSFGAILDLHYKLYIIEFYLSKLGVWIISKYQSSLCSSNAKALLCTRDWLFDLKDEDEVDKKELIDEDIEKLVKSSRRSFLRTGHALIDVYGEEITLRVNDEAVTFNINQTMRYLLYI
uniref:Zinc finger BED domain-containing protein RICESLEEPER 2-like n=1 Tax=Tanacetum cinerariifolium TaxID=118510 RepID=A0A6L2MM00_TANCI|nr:zinc finger BED domain-containing protein RICESLEEPER 2-like [Tanacetum cinerariifolium]